jgi:ribosomal protein S2
MSRIQEMFEVGAHYGYSRTRRHPTTKQYIYGSKNRTDIIDLEKTEAQLAKVEELLKSIVSNWPSSNLCWNKTRITRFGKNNCRINEYAICR